tara:strand:- start:47 stop:202 length:156 start_codon:yes stop_codon:yes gene_type:complete
LWAITTRLLEYELASASAALLVALSLGTMGVMPTRPVSAAICAGGGDALGD